MSKKKNPQSKQQHPASFTMAHQELSTTPLLVQESLVPAGSSPQEGLSLFPGTAKSWVPGRSKELKAL